MAVTAPLAAVFCGFFLLFCDTVLSFEFDLTIEVAPGGIECFYQPVNKEMEIEIDFQVIEGGDHDISFQVTGVGGRVLAAQMKQSEANHKFTAKEVGDYKVCFDNSHSSLSRKLVFFSLFSRDDENNDVFKEVDDIEAAKELVDIRLDDFKTMVGLVHGRLDKAIQHQMAIKHHEARDRNVQEANFERVNNWSLLQLIVMLAVAAVQVFMIRQLFDDRSKVSTIKART